MSLQRAGVLVALQAIESRALVTSIRIDELEQIGELKLVPVVADQGLRRTGRCAPSGRRSLARVGGIAAWSYKFMFHRFIIRIEGEERERERYTYHESRVVLFGCTNILHI